MIAIGTTETDGPVRIQPRSRADGSISNLPIGWYPADYEADANDGWGRAIWADNPARRK